MSSTNEIAVRCGTLLFPQIKSRHRIAIGALPSHCDRIGVIRGHAVELHLHAEGRRQTGISRKFRGPVQCISDDWDFSGDCLANRCENADVVRKELSDVLPHFSALKEFFLPGAEVESVLCGWGVKFESEVVTGEKEAG